MFFRNMIDSRYVLPSVIRVDFTPLTSQDLLSLLVLFLSHVCQVMTKNNHFFYRAVIEKCYLILRQWVSPMVLIARENRLKVNKILLDAFLSPDHRWPSATFVEQSDIGVFFSHQIDQEDTLYLVNSYKKSQNLPVKKINGVRCADRKGGPLMALMGPKLKSVTTTGGPHCSHMLMNRIDLTKCQNLML